MLIAIIALVIGAALYVVNMVGVNINANVICSLGVLIVGFAMLIKGADLFVEGASKIAAKFKIPQIVIGLTIVAMGTSAPEAAISISAAFQDAAAISIGNVVGSNIMNILLILGVSAVITNLKIKPNTLKFEIPFVVLITAVLLLLGWIGGGLDKIDGVIMLVLGSLSALGYGSLADVKIIGMQFLDFFDFLTNTVMMPIAAIATCLFVSRVVGVKRIEEEVTYGGGTFRRKKIFVVMIKYLCPIFAIIIPVSYTHLTLPTIA